MQFSVGPPLLCPVFLGQRVATLRIIYSKEFVFSGERCSLYPYDEELLLLAHLEQRITVYSREFTGFTGATRQKPTIKYNCPPGIFQKFEQIGLPKGTILTLLSLMAGIIVF